jgi:acyl-coenzyme A synthetase/AMP-(fatty) acid ligase
MSGLNSRPWFVDGRTGAVTTYGELSAALNGPAACVRPLFRPAATREALLELTRALAAGADLTLFDTTFGAHEVAGLGFREELINQPGPAFASGLRPADLPRLVDVASPARLSLFTSGSTGLPTRVTHTLATLGRGVRVSDRHADDVWALAYNPTHIAGLQVYLQALANGNPTVDVFGCDRATVLAALRNHGVTHISGTPTFYRLLLPADAPVPGVRAVTLGGESSDAMLLERLAPLFPAARFHNVYASTEAGTLLISEGDAFSIPPALAGRVILRDGRLHVHASLLGGFHGQKAMAGEWYDTGDVAEIVSAEPLRFRLVARERDWINVGGNKVNPFEVETVLEQFEGIAKARVYGRKNSVLGQVLCADVVSTGSPPTEQALREFATARLQPFKVPRFMKFVEKLGQTRTGKLTRT